MAETFWQSVGSGSYTPYVSSAGYGLEAFAQIAQGILAAKRAKSYARYNAQVVEANARAEAQAAELEAQQYMRQVALLQQEQQILQQAQAYREGRQRETNERTLGQTRAIIASSGLMMEGSPLAAYEDLALEQERDILAGRYEATLQQRALDESITHATFGAEMARYGGRERLRVGDQQASLLRAEGGGGNVAAGFMRAGGSLLRGGADYVYGQERRKARDPYRYPVP
jgi:hypothetical protein